NNCIFFSLDKVLEYADVINIVQADESNRLVDRKEVQLFDNNAFREAIINAFVHNLWVDGNAPMITIFSDRIEILSRGTLAPNQTKEGFYKGESIPVNQALSDMFLQLHISERSGRGVPKITKIYGENAFEFRDNSIVVNIPFKRLSSSLVNELEEKTIDKEIKLNKSQKKILDAIRDNPNLTLEDLSVIIGVANSTIEKNIRQLKANGVIARMGSKKNGYWTIL
ncbi:MAG: ATP-binding protein, partial [Succinivibrio sp.]